VRTDPTRFLIRLANETLPPPVLRFARRVQRYWYGYGWRKPPELAPLPLDASPQFALIHRAWQLATRSPANQVGLCYYSLSFEGVSLPGERAWERRWELLHRAVVWQGARVLDLGCNLGLLATSALLAGAEDALGVDNDPGLLAANQLVQRAFGVRYRTVQRDFNDPHPWENELAAFRPTVVVALSVLNWVGDQARFLRFLSRFGTVLFEGHDSDVAEQERLERAGWTEIALLGRSEHGRALFRARRPDTRERSDGNPIATSSGRWVPSAP
jgi:SAM-dependent methyltransferase